MTVVSQSGSTGRMGRGGIREATGSVSRYRGMQIDGMCLVCFVVDVALDWPGQASHQPSQHHRLA